MRDCAASRSSLEEDTRGQWVWIPSYTLSGNDRLFSPSFSSSVPSLSTYFFSFFLSVCSSFRLFTSYLLRFPRFDLPPSSSLSSSMIFLFILFFFLIIPIFILFPYPLQATPWPCRGA